jgi:hypothetical protein
MDLAPRSHGHLPADVSADLYGLLEAGWAVTGLQLVDVETGPAYLISASAGEWSLLSAYPRDAAMTAQWSASLYRSPDEYVVLDRDEFITIASGTRNDLMRAWAAKEHEYLVLEESEDGPNADEPAGGDVAERVSFAGFMTIRGSSASTPSCIVASSTSVVTSSRPAICLRWMRDRLSKSADAYSWMRTTTSQTRTSLLNFVPHSVTVAPTA